MSRGHGFVKDSVSVVIVCFNRFDLTEACIGSVLDSDDLPDEIILVDNHSTDDTAEWLAAVAKQGYVGRIRSSGVTTCRESPGASFEEYGKTPVQVATLTENVGWGRGANIGAQLAEGEYLLHLNNDTEVRPNWLTPLVEAMDDKTAVVAGKLLNPDGSVQHQGITLYDDTNGTLTAQNMTEPGPIEALSLAAALCRADAWAELGGIDPRYFCGYEDVDYCLRARQAGWGLKYVPESEVMHIAGASGPMRWAHTQDNIRLLNERWSGVTV